MNKKISVVIHSDRLQPIVTVEGERHGTFKTTKFSWRGHSPSDLPWEDELKLPLYWSHGKIVIEPGSRPKQYDGPVLFEYTPHQDSPPIAVAVCDRNPARSFLVAEWMTMTGLINCYPSTKTVDIFLFPRRKEARHDDR